VFHDYQCALDLYNALNERHKAVNNGSGVPAALMPGMWHSKAWITAFDAELLEVASKNGVASGAYPSGSLWAFVDHTVASGGSYDAWIAANSNAAPPRVGQSTAAATWTKLLTMAGHATKLEPDIWHMRAVLEQRRDMVSALSHVAHYIEMKAGTNNGYYTIYQLSADSPGQSKITGGGAARGAKISAAISAAGSAAAYRSSHTLLYSSGFAGKYSSIEWWQDRNDGYANTDWSVTVRSEAHIGHLDLRFGSTLAADVDLYMRLVQNNSGGDLSWLLYRTEYVNITAPEHDTFGHTINMPGSVSTYMSLYATKARAASTAVNHIICDQSLGIAWPTTTDPNTDGTEGYKASVRGYNLQEAYASPYVDQCSFAHAATVDGVDYPPCVAVIRYTWDYA
jgi:hypothetical protein